MESQTFLGFVDTYWFYAISLALFGVIAYRFAGDKVKAFLDQQIDTIKSQLDQAEALKEEGKQLEKEAYTAWKDAQGSMELALSNASREGESKRVIEKEKIQKDSVLRKQSIERALLKEQSRVVSDLSSTLYYTAEGAVKEKLLTADSHFHARLIDQAITELEQKQ